MVHWKLILTPIKYIKVNKKNPRQISKKQVQHLEDLITTYGMIDKPILNVDLTLIGGHQRLKLLKKMKIKEIPCWIPDRLLSDKDVDRLCVGLNLNQGTWDYDILANEYEMLDLLEWGFTEEQLVGDCKIAEEKVSDGVDDEKPKKMKSCPHCGGEI